MKTLAAVLVEPGRPLELADLEVPALQPGQVLVELLYSGVCQTQVGEWLGWRGPDRFLPHCLGHEGCGRVLDVGAGVSRCQPGEEVILSWIKAAGFDVSGSIYCWGDRKVNAGGVTTFSKHAVVSENRVSLLPTGVSHRAAALIGCAVATGFGAVVNTAGHQPGQSVVVFGVGGIGLCAVAAAAARGASRIAAVDQRLQRLEIARRLGATDVVDVSTSDPISALKTICPHGWDIAIEATGRPGVMQIALSAVRPRGGSAVVVGNARFGESLTVDPMEFNLGKRLLGTWGGDTNPDRDFPKYCEWIATGMTAVELLLDGEYGLAQTTLALEDLHAGRCTRPLINMKL
jgi:S-(hydroxymethyl)glutathione dehydrogenase / alcohol dehydrogenase